MADISYPYAQINASYGDLQTVGLMIYASNEDGPEGSDLDSVVAAVRAYLEGLPGVSSTTSYRTDLISTQQT